MEREPEPLRGVPQALLGTMLLLLLAGSVVAGGLALLESMTEPRDSWVCTYPNVLLEP